MMLHNHHTNFYAIPGTEKVAAVVMQNSEEVDASTAELAHIMEAASAILEEMSGTVETLTEDSKTIASAIQETTGKAEALREV
ncbi:hypothetical protein [Halobacillus salinus]|uniref:hypothetical protein n=1 Tax=Halobacillus salinus TaxID=192814 RepID=UPI0015914977|nr:hypothetical protein [Halobacillus salinus]